MNKNGYELFGGEVNTMVCSSFSDGYYPLFKHLSLNGNFTPSRLGDTMELLTFKTVLLEPLKRATVAKGRHVNIFFHLAESLWVLAGRNDLEFIALFNSRFHHSSDDGVTLYGGYGKRLRYYNSGSTGIIIDQLYEACAKLNTHPDLRRIVISLWDSSMDLGKASRDLPCNTQLMFRLREGSLYTTVINRSNDLHWGVIANIFQFSVLSEIMALLLDVKFTKQTHVAQSLHYYTDNHWNERLTGEAIHQIFYENYPPATFEYNFNNGTDNFELRFRELDNVLKELPKIVLNAYKSDNSLDVLWEELHCLQTMSQSIYDIARLLLLYVCYLRDLAGTDKEILRCEYLRKLLQAKASFRHQDYWALAVNHFFYRIKSKNAFADEILDVNLGNY